VLPLAHAGHYAVWVLYALPVLFVAIAIVRSHRATKRQQPDLSRGTPAVPQGEDASPAGGRGGEVEHDPARRPPLP
jgi:hypothetical protein